MCVCEYHKHLAISECEYARMDGYIIYTMYDENEVFCYVQRPS